MTPTAFSSTPWTPSAGSNPTSPSVSPLPSLPALSLPTPLIPPRAAVPALLPANARSCSSSPKAKATRRWRRSSASASILPKRIAPTSWSSSISTPLPKSSSTPFATESSPPDSPSASSPLLRVRPSPPGALSPLFCELRGVCLRLFFLLPRNLSSLANSPGLHHPHTRGREPEFPSEFSLGNRSNYPFLCFPALLTNVTQGHLGEQMHATKKIRVLIADDSPTALRSICEYLEFAGTFEIVGTASDGQNAVQLATLYKPDLVLLDLSMPRVTGLEAAEHIRLSNPDIRIIIFSELQGLSLAEECLRHGAHSFVPKSLLPEGLLMEIQRLFPPGGRRAVVEGVS